MIGDDSTLPAEDINNSEITPRVLRHSPKPWIYILCIFYDKIRQTNIEVIPILNNPPYLTAAIPRVPLLIRLYCKRHLSAYGGNSPCCRKTLRDTDDSQSDLLQN